ncbi:hypothetical protein DFJ73DRAFT_756904 [Zopfochytrium polystomum]|nr:hypothetical protein DFJ73DRAFT_756904 [Zopfochytrium polystomum]
MAVSFYAANTEQFYFATQTKGDSEEWLSALSPLAQRCKINRIATGLNLRRQTQKTNYLPGNSPVMSGFRIDRTRSRRHKDDDARSVASFDDAASVLSSLAPSITEAEDIHSLSAVETLATAVGKAPAQLESAFIKDDITERWNEKYQMLANLCRGQIEEEMLRTDVEIVGLIGLFEEAATAHAMKMVDEYHIRGGTVTQGTVAIDGIILHFACNYDIATPEEAVIASARSASELRSIDAFNQKNSAFQTALMVLIDYKGFRIVAYADMGIDVKTTPVWDLQIKPIQVEDRITEALGQVGRGLNLKQHGVQIGDDRRVTTPLSWTIEIHHDKECGHDYAVSLFETFPMDFHIPHQPTPSSSPTRSNTNSPSRTNTLNTSIGAAAGKLGRTSVPSYSSALVDATLTAPHPSRRLRPEFLAAYSAPICADAFTPASGCGHKEREMNDAEAARASRFLRENWVPAFVRKLDELEIRPVDSRLIASLSTIPYTKDLCCIEMVARASKRIFNGRMRSLIIHFRSVGATQVEEETRSWTANTFCLFLGASEKSEKCGVVFEDTTDYDFRTANPCPRGKLVGFTTRRKHPSGLPRMSVSSPHSKSKGSGSSAAASDATLPPPVPEDERLAYHLARHFRTLGPKSKLARSDVSALRLTEVAAHYNATGRHEEAKKYATAAVSAALQNSCVAGLARAQLIEAIGALQVGPGSGGPDPAILSAYRAGVALVQWHCGLSHPIGMALHDRMCTIYIKARKYEQALEFHNISLSLAMNALGKNHIVTAGYRTKVIETEIRNIGFRSVAYTLFNLLGEKAGILQSQLRQTDEAIHSLNEALHIYTTLSATSTLLAEVHAHLADAYDARGDPDAAINHAQRSRRLREKALGQMDPRSVASCLQVASLLMKPFENYAGVLTPPIRSAYRDTITCYEKAFRYIKTHLMAQHQGQLWGMHVLSSSASVLSSSGASTAPSSVVHVTSVAGSALSGSVRRTGSTMSVPVGDGWPSFTPARALPVAGPAISPPFAPMPPLPKSILHKLTRRIITLKLALLETPRHRELIRTLRAALQKGEGDGETVDAAGIVAGSTLSVGQRERGLYREVIVKMAAVSPSIYLDGVIARIDDEDESAVDELAIALELSEKDTLKLPS